MRRAVAVLLLLAAWPLTAHAWKPTGPVDAVGMLGYQYAPRFKVGDWVRYHTHGKSAQGYLTDYTVTILIAGEELWWGEECFWVETRTTYKESTSGEEVTASLLSYAVFQDSLPHRNFQMYMRKMCDGVDDNGLLVQQPFLRSASQITTRGFEPYVPHRTRDTVGVREVTVPKGPMNALHVKENYREATTKQDGDSTVYFELNEDHDYHYSEKVPITGLVRLDQENTQRRRVWLIGESEDAPLRVVEHTRGTTELVDWGSGMRTTYLPASVQRPLKEQRVSEAKRPAATGKRPAAKRPSGG